MITVDRSRTLALGTATASALLLSACGVDTGSGGSSDSAASDSSVAAVTQNDELATLLPQEIQDVGVLTVGTPLNNPPSIFVDEAGEPTGYSYDLAVEMGVILGVDIVFQDLAFPGVIPGLQSGQFDLSMGVIGDTPERQELLDFVDYSEGVSGILLPADGPAVESLADMCGSTIGALAGSLQISLINAASEDCTAGGDDAITINEYASATDAQAQVASGRVAGFMAPLLTIQYSASTAGDGETFTVASEQYLTGLPAAIGYAKGRGTLGEALLGALQTLVDNGTYDEILARYDAQDGALPADRIVINGAGTDAFPTGTR